MNCRVNEVIASKAIDFINVQQLEPGKTYLVNLKFAPNLNNMDLANYAKRIKEVFDQNGINVIINFPQAVEIDMKEVTEEQGDSSNG